MHIVISGASFVGMILAIVLKQNGFTVTIVEEKASLNRRDNRGIAINANSKDFLSQLGVWSALAAHAAPIEEIRVVDNHSPLFLHFSNELVGDEILGYIIEGEYIKQTLHDACHKQNIKIHYQTTITSTVETHPTHISISFDNMPVIDAKILILADGIHSKNLKLTDIKLKSYDYMQTAMTMKVGHEEHHGNIAIEHFMQSGPFAILPGEGGYHSHIVWTESSDKAYAYQNLLSKEWLMEDLREKFTDYLGPLEIIGEIQSYPIKLSYAENYSCGRIGLLGNLLHNIHPIAGQGLNLAIEDIKALSELFVKQRNLGFDIDNFTLKEFEKIRRKHNNNMINITHMFDSLFSNNNICLSAARKIGLGGINKLNVAKKFFMEYAMGKHKTTDK